MSGSAGQQLPLLSCTRIRNAQRNGTVQVGLGCRQVMSLSEAVEVENMVEATIATAIETMAYVPC